MLFYLHHVYSDYLSCVGCVRHYVPDFYNYGAINKDSCNTALKMLLRGAAFIYRTPVHFDALSE